MGLFFLVFFGTYASMHGYLFWKIHRAMPWMGWAARVAVAVFLLAMILSPIGVRAVERAGHFRLAGAWALVGHTWIAVILWFCCALLIGDLWNLLVRLGSLPWPPARRVMLSPGVLLAGATALVAIALVWGVGEARSIRAHRLTIATSALPAGSRPLVIAQITDVHLGVDTGTARLERALELVREAHPDVLVSTGDLVDSRLADIPHLADMLRQVEAPLGKYAIFGNHEFYLGIAASTEFHEAAGFRILRHDAVTVDGHLRIVGVDDRDGGLGRTHTRDENGLLGPRTDGQFTLLLKHRPEVSPASLGRFDLQLSGHTHGGQIFPFQLATRLVFPLYRGLYDLREGSRLYTSTGVGTWGPPTRVLARPEVAIITLTPQ